MAWEAGGKLGPYEILAPIGAGGMGEVWKARDPRLNRTVAIKRQKTAHSTRFEKEARAIAALNHPHICQIYDVGPDYLVMEYIEGVPVQGPLPPQKALQIALQVASALEAAHSKGIIHRDLKPANILFSPSGVKLLDFGLAKLPETEPDATQTAEGTIAGTAAYMSPEQAQGKPLDPRSDIFSFGAVLYELLGGDRSFAGHSYAEVLSAVLRDEPRPLEAPPELVSVVGRCLRKAREERYSSVAELRAALEHVRLRADQPSIVVLPFANMSRDSDDEYFSDGLAEEIINALVKVPGLKVIARTSAFAFKGQNIDIRKIGEILGVTNIMEGSVRRSGNRIRVTAQLVTAADGTHLWSERYDRQLEDLFVMQDEIASAITTELKLRFAPSVGVRPRRQPNLQAYEAYLRYRQYQWGFTPESLRRSRECLEQAIALDPEFALPYVGLADHHMASTMAGQSANEAVARVRELARRALELDPDLPEGHGILGNVAGLFDLDWKEAERRFRLATACEPVPWHVRAWYCCFFLLPLRRLEEARREAERALEDNPLSEILYWNLSIVLEALGLENEARAAHSKIVELAPHFWLGWYGFGMHHTRYGRHAEAKTCGEKAFALFPAPLNIGLLAGSLRNVRETAGAEALLAQLPPDTHGFALMRTCFHLVCGEIDAAVEWAGKAADERHLILVPSIVRPFESLLRQSFGWPALLRRLNLTV